MDFQHILYQPGKVARIIFNRPQCLNAQGFLLLEETDRAFKLAEGDKECGAIVLSGEGRAFSAGHDISTEEDRQYREAHGYSDPAGKDGYKTFHDMRDFYVEKTLAWRNSPKPTVAMVHGYCIYGGWMLAAAMDVILAAEDCLFLPGMVEYFSAPWDLGPRKAKEILLEHRFMTAAEALEYGFVNRVFPTERLEEETLAYADRVADNHLAHPSWTRMIKTSINHMQDAMGFTSEIEAAYSNFCLMISLLAEELPSPDEGGFARTDVAKRNFASSEPWLEQVGLRHFGKRSTPR
jgi:enoyl-CoA hydratase